MVTFITDNTNIKKRVEETSNFFKKKKKKHETSIKNSSLWELGLMPPLLDF